MPDKTGILLITRNLPPLVGGMERLLWHLVDELRKYQKIDVIGPAGCRARVPESVKATEVTIRTFPLFLGHTLWASLVETLARRPAVVLAGSGLTAPFAWIAARLTRARCAVYLHGLDIESSNPGYRRLWHPFLRRMDCVIANSRFTRSVAIRAGIKEELLHTVLPGVSLPDLSIAKAYRSAFRSRYKIGDAPVLLYIGRITERKGLDVFVDQIFPRIVQEHPTAKLIVIGDEPALALTKSVSIRARIDATLEQHCLARNVLFLGPRAHDDIEITEAYFAADVHVFPVQDRPGDNEGFGMVAVEAAAHGLPTVAYDAGGVRDAVSGGRSGHLIKSGDAAGFSDAVSHELTHGVRPSLPARQFSESLEWSHFGQRLNTIIQDLSTQQTSRSATH
ncbi:MAG: glycosyltransferase family 4 protein [Gammaproteobacteria bacterium]|nr:glycosyltransferase family 4 protein [Gammaproteobacteria bacterium]